ncbi:3-deoxy-D-manno-octulosonic acid transferase [Flagellimonas taeanensis]|uniref:3-deoxy-D-manno-octulosonic acid transferase n=1 Tax=Flavobacteriaceae TaxID=49546 RepID=UPI000E684692|nr:MULTISPECIES: glycosyltransferase N-terminal domain-containing protein [Allomuricauda]MDC6384047.1 glycosyltransferase N-terminal domain-containing protein [Muricauda sp. SK9]RIV48780.1 3-deoxy-D-manno-octulosonic acid transferase [Allomuricauda taeanensis]
MPLRFFYNILISLAWFGLKVIALFRPKIDLFVSGRKQTFAQLGEKLSPNKKTIWMHVASLGEYEQGLPILERLRQNYPAHQILLTFFSPSGYEVKKNTTAADAVVYLPMDTLSNAKRFLERTDPELAIFVKYEIWPNYLSELKKRNVPTFLVSAIFSKRQVYFKPFGGFMRKSLRTFAHFFVQDSNSRELLESIGLSNVTVSGDTRFDRVSKILKQDNRLDFMEHFKNGKFCLVAGSTWPEDEEILIQYINLSTDGQTKFVFAPHEIKPAHVQKIEEGLQRKTMRFSQMEGKDLADFDVLIVDTIGLLTKVYSYADVAYVGGGFATGLHNTLEPSVYGIPVIIGPDYTKFKEAEDLVKKGGVIPISDQRGFDTLMDTFLTDPIFLRKTGSINSEYINANVGATDLILEHLSLVKFG